MVTTIYFSEIWGMERTGSSSNEKERKNGNYRIAEELLHPCNFIHKTSKGKYYPPLRQDNFRTLTTPMSLSKQLEGNGSTQVL